MVDHSAFWAAAAPVMSRSMSEGIEAGLAAIEPVIRANERQRLDRLLRDNWGHDYDGVVSFRAVLRLIGAPGSDDIDTFMRPTLYRGSVAEYRNGRVRYCCTRCQWKGRWTVDHGLACDRALDHSNSAVHSDTDPA